MVFSTISLDIYIRTPPGFSYCCLIFYPLILIFKYSHNTFKDNFNRLVKIKTRVNPEIFFRHEQGIPLLSIKDNSNHFFNETPTGFTIAHHLYGQCSCAVYEPAQQTKN